MQHNRDKYNKEKITRGAPMQKYLNQLPQASVFIHVRVVLLWCKVDLNKTNHCFFYY